MLSFAIVYIVLIRGACVLVELEMPLSVYYSRCA